MSRKRGFPSLLGLALIVGSPVVASAADSHHVHLVASNATEAVKWYVQHMDCEPIEGRINATDCGSMEIVFVVLQTLGGSQGTGVDHIGFSFADLETKMAELEGIGVRGSGVRLQRFEDGATLRDVPGLFKLGFVFDPWAGHRR